jgi:hypothetical protein
MFQMKIRKVLFLALLAGLALAPRPSPAVDAPAAATAAGEQAASTSYGQQAAQYRAVATQNQQLADAAAKSKDAASAKIQQHADLHARRAAELAARAQPRPAAAVQ